MNDGHNLCLYHMIHLALIFVYNQLSSELELKKTKLSAAKESVNHIMKELRPLGVGNCKPTNSTYLMSHSVKSAVLWKEGCCDVQFLNAQLCIMVYTTCDTS